MPESNSDINSLICSIEPIRGARPVTKLSGGPASDSWLVQAGRQKFVLRIDKPIAASLGLDRQAETGILQTVSDAGIGAPVIWADPDKGILVCRYLEGGTWCREDTRSPERLRELALTLKKLHRLSPRGPAFEPAAAARLYAQKIGTDRAHQLARDTAQLAAELYAEPGRLALCHNDLVHGNIIGHGPVRLIDWEYAAVGDPFFDLAVLVQHHDLNMELREKFLQFYCGSAEADDLARLAGFCRLYDHLARLWYIATTAKNPRMEKTFTEVAITS